MQSEKQRKHLVDLKKIKEVKRVEPKKFDSSKIMFKGRKLNFKIARLQDKGRVNLKKPLD